MSDSGVFKAALKLSPDEREAYLEQACGADQALRQEVESLLRAHNEGGSFLEKPACGGATVDSPPAAECPGSVIGPYKLLEQIGEGGFGAVFLAEQQEPVRRKVALKVLKPGMDTRQVVARFEAERQALAIMDHPHIAKVFDGGATPSGRPYFVMELVKGVPITDFCDQSRLEPCQRLELFVTVCQAVQHAHQKGIIHRDLKPSNVLVSRHDTAPVVKVIDFGIAKALGQELTDKTLFTGLAQMVGTPLYMSPEQAGMSDLDIDTRSDIYSLGVLLYELLTGTTPFDRERFKQAGYDELRRIIREEEPPKPSTRLSTAGQAATSISANRGTEPAKLTRLLRGELDWIVMKALEKDRNRRYETANGFALDVQRYLADEPVLACPPSAGYRLRKFARRNKRTLATAALFGTLLVAAVGAVGWAVRDGEAERQALAEKAERDREADRQALALKAKLDRAARQGRIGAQVDLILGEVRELEKAQKWPEALAAARRAGARTADGADAATRVRVRQVLRDLEMVAELEELHLRETHGAEAGAYNDAGRPRLYAAAFRALGVDVKALPAAEAAARLCARPAVAVALAAALDDWARAGRLRAPEQSKRLWALAAAVDPDPWRVSVRRAAAALDAAALKKLAQSPKTARQPPQSQLLLASSLWLCYQPVEAIALLERASEIHPGDFWIHLNLGRFNCNIRPARLEAAVRHNLAARALRPRSSATWNNLGIALKAQGNQDQAIACYRKAIELDGKNAGAHHNLGDVLNAQRKLDEAIRHYRKAIELEPDSPWTLNNLGNALKDLRKLDEAVACYRKAIQLRPKDLTARAYNNIAASNYNNLGNALWVQGKRQEAMACYRKAVELEPHNASWHTILGDHLVAPGERDEAIRCYRKAVALEPQNAGFHRTLALALAQQGRVAEAIASQVRANKLDPKSAGSLGNLIPYWWFRPGKLDEAIAAFKEAIRLEPGHADYHFALGKALRLRNKLDEAVAAFRKAIALEPQNAGFHSTFGEALRAQKKLDEAVAAFRKAIALEPQNAIFHRTLALALAQQGRVAEAIASHCRAIDLAPYNAQSTALGSLFGYLGQQAKQDEAIAAFKEAIRLKPGHADYHFALGEALRLQKKLNEAIPAYRQAIQLKPQELPYRLVLAQMLQLQAKHAEAIAEYQQIVRIQPKDAWAHWYLANALRQHNKLDEAVTELRVVVRLQKDLRSLVQAHLHLGQILSQLNRLDEAVVAFREAVRIQPKNSWNRSHLHYQLGVALGKKGKRDEAIAAYQEAVRLGPNDSTAHFGLASGLVGAKQWDRAATVYAEGLKRFGTPLESGPWYEAIGSKEVFTRLTALRPEDRRPWIMRARLHVLQRDWKRAAADYAGLKEALAKGGEVAFLRQHFDDLAAYACVLLLLGDRPGYEQFCKKCVEQFGRSPGGEFLLARVCAFSPRAVVPPRQLVEWGRTTMKTNTYRDPRYLHALSLAHYRKGEFDLAIKHAQESKAG
jgi:tetratricopeptide (TPR) repeat protein/serine/threonine protein kinase